MNTSITIIKIVVIFIVTIGVIETKICPHGKAGEEIDWTKLAKKKKTFYDVIDIPTPTTPFDCYNWKNIRVTDDGFISEVHKYIEGMPGESTMNARYVYTGNGTYSLSSKNDFSFLKKGQTATNTMMPSSDEQFQYFLNQMLQLKFYFFTDYETYLAAAACIPGSVFGWVKFTKQNPGGKIIAKVWDKFSEYGELPRITWKTKCVRRKYLQKGN
ncbi:uncharacterized protein LOC120348444 [Styela clava]